MRLLRLTPLLIAALLPAAAWAADKTAAEGLASTADPVQVTCEKISHKLGSVSLAECLQASLQTTGAWSVQEQPILIKEYPPLGNRTPRARVLMLGGIHGDEYSSVSIVFKWMQTLDRYHSGLFHWRVVPLLNPDGLLQAESSRLNANGIDLNRNFPTPDWYAQTRDYWERPPTRIRAAIQAKPHSASRNHAGCTRKSAASNLMSLCPYMLRTAFLISTAPPELRTAWVICI